MSRDWRLYLNDMVGSCHAIEEFTCGMSQDEFVGNRTTYWSTVKMIEIIGEAARHIPEDIQALMPETEWKNIIAARHVFAHGYFGIDDDVLWDIVVKFIPELLHQIEDFLIQDTKGEW